MPGVCGAGIKSGQTSVFYPEWHDLPSCPSWHDLPETLKPETPLWLSSGIPLTITQVRKANCKNHLA